MTKAMNSYDLDYEMQIKISLFLSIKGAVCKTHV